MTSDVIDGIKPRFTGSTETVVGFSPERLHAPLSLRIGALLIDYMLILMLPVGGLLFERVFGNAGIVTDRTLWLISSMIFLLNIVLLPVLTGRSVGKLLTGLRIVNKDGSLPRRRSILLRQTVGLLLSAFTLGLGFVLSLFNSRGRALHDYFAGTVVVHGRRRIR